MRRFATTLDMIEAASHGPLFSVFRVDPVALFNFDHRSQKVARLRRPILGRQQSFAIRSGLQRRLPALQSRKTTLKSELWTDSLPLYSMKPSLRNLFMKKLTRGRVVPTISANVS